MTRREGIVAGLAAAAGLMSGKAQASGIANTSSITVPIKGGLTFNLDGFTEFKFICGKDEVRLTPEEIMAALKSK